MPSTDLEQLIDEHHALAHHYGQVQLRCSELVRAQAAEIEMLRAQAIRMRAALVVRDTALAWAQQDRDAVEASADLADLEGSLDAADLVICQTGCLSHGAYWRVRDICRRTGKACMVVAEPDAVRIVRIHKPQAREPQLD